MRIFKNINQESLNYGQLLVVNLNDVTTEYNVYGFNVKDEDYEKNLAEYNTALQNFTLEAADDDPITEELHEQCTKEFDEQYEYNGPRGYLVYGKPKEFVTWEHEDDSFVTKSELNQFFDETTPLDPEEMDQGIEYVDFWNGSDWEKVILTSTVHTVLWEEVTSSFEPFENWSKIPQEVGALYLFDKKTKSIFKVEDDFKGQTCVTRIEDKDRLEEIAVLAIDTDLEDKKLEVYLDQLIGSTYTAIKVKMKFTVEEIFEKVKAATDRNSYWNFTNWRNNKLSELQNLDWVEIRYRFLFRLAIGQPQIYNEVGIQFQDLSPQLQEDLKNYYGSLEDPQYVIPEVMPGLEKELPWLVERIGKKAPVYNVMTRKNSRIVYNGNLSVYHYTQQEGLETIEIETYKGKRKAILNNSGRVMIIKKKYHTTSNGWCDDVILQPWEAACTLVAGNAYDFAAIGIYKAIVD